MSHVASRRFAVICAKKPPLITFKNAFPSAFPYLTCHLFYLSLPSWFFPRYGMGHWRFSLQKSVMVRKRTVWTVECNLRVVFTCKTVSIPKHVPQRAERSSAHSAFQFYCSNRDTCLPPSLSLVSF